MSQSPEIITDTPTGRQNVLQGLTQFLHMHFIYYISVSCTALIFVSLSNTTS